MGDVCREGVYCAQSGGDLPFDMPAVNQDLRDLRFERRGRFFDRRLARDHGRQETRQYLAPHIAVFGNVRRADDVQALECQRRYRPTRGSEPGRVRPARPKSAMANCPARVAVTPWTPLSVFVKQTSISQVSCPDARSCWRSPDPTGSGSLPAPQPRHPASGINWKPILPATSTRYPDRCHRAGRYSR